MFKFNKKDQNKNDRFSFCGQIKLSIRKAKPRYFSTCSRASI